MATPSNTYIHTWAGNRYTVPRMRSFRIGYSVGLHDLEKSDPVEMLPFRGFFHGGTFPTPVARLCYAASLRDKSSLHNVPDILVSSMRDFVTRSAIPTLYCMGASVPPAPQEPRENGQGASSDQPPPIYHAVARLSHVLLNRRIEMAPPARRNIRD